MIMPGRSWVAGIDILEWLLTGFAAGRRVCPDALANRYCCRCGLKVCILYDLAHFWNLQQKEKIGNSDLLKTAKMSG
jgi:hypothetical protein